MSEIDVSKCEFLCKDVHCSCYVDYSECSEDYKPTFDLCKWHSDCYYKQLQQLKQENEMLKIKINQYDFHYEVVDNLKELNANIKQLSQTVFTLR